MNSSEHIIKEIFCYMRRKSIIRLSSDAFSNASELFQYPIISSEFDPHSVPYMCAFIAIHIGLFV